MNDVNTVTQATQVSDPASQPAVSSAPPAPPIPAGSTVPSAPPVPTPAAPEKPSTDATTPKEGQDKPKGKGKGSAKNKGESSAKEPLSSEKPSTDATTPMVTDAVENIAMIVGKSDLLPEARVAVGLIDYDPNDVDTETRIKICAASILSELMIKPFPQGDRRPISAAGTLVNSVGRIVDLLRTSVVVEKGDER